MKVETKNLKGKESSDKYPKVLTNEGPSTKRHKNLSIVFNSKGHAPLNNTPLPRLIASPRKCGDKVYLVK